MLSHVGTRSTAVDEAARRARRQIEDVTRDLRDARMAAGLSQAVVASGTGVSRSVLASWERGEVEATGTRMARWGAVVGIDVVIRAHAAGSPLRDAGQLRLISRARAAIGEAEWTWRTEVPVSRDPHDRRAFDAVLSSHAGHVGLEAITRLTDAQAQVRAAVLKQETARLERLILVLVQTRHNRAAVVAAAPTLSGAFPAKPREVLRALRAGRLPQANGIVLV